MTDPTPRGERAAADDAGLALPTTPRSVSRARQYARSACAALGWADCADSVGLLVSEVVTNAILHAYGAEVRLRVLDLGLRLRVEVSDGSPALPTPRTAAARAENGRGLALVEALAVAWGTDLSPGGKTVWFEVGI